MWRNTQMSETVTPKDSTHIKNQQTLIANNLLSSSPSNLIFPRFLDDLLNCRSVAIFSELNSKSKALYFKCTLRDIKIALLWRQPWNCQHKCVMSSRCTSHDYVIAVNRANSSPSYFVTVEFRRSTFTNTTEEFLHQVKSSRCIVQNLKLSSRTLWILSSKPKTWAIYPDRLLKNHGVTRNNHRHVF